MVINDEHTVTEAVMYHPYGSMVPVENVLRVTPSIFATVRPVL